jgi:hypothetical protein
MAGIVPITAIRASQAAYGMRGQSGIESKRPAFDWGSALGPISSGLNMFGGAMDSINMFMAANNYRNQAGNLRTQAAQALEQGFTTGIDIQHEGGEALGEMTVAFGKSGTLLEGSPLLALADTTREIEKNVGRAIQQGRIEQQALIWQAENAERAAEGAMIGGIANIVGTAAKVLVA